MRPTLQHHIARQGTHIIEKGLASHQHLAQPRLLLIAPLQDRMEEQRQQVEAEQKRPQVSLAVTKVMVDMIARRFEHIVLVVFDFPSPTTRLCPLRDGFSTQAMSGEKAIVIELLTRFGLDHHDLQPMHGS
jgi:hypothetical protein